MSRNRHSGQRTACLWGVFFFQAEDGIRDGRVTGVQTCALPICHAGGLGREYHVPAVADQVQPEGERVGLVGPYRDRKSTRLNSSHPSISYAVFCLKKKKKKKTKKNYDKKYIERKHSMHSRHVHK